MKKVAIMTWFHYHNFGTALQVVALSRVVEKLGYQADVIQYVPHGRVVTLPDGNGWLYYVEKIKQKIASGRLVKDVVREDAFREFINQELTLTASCQTASELYRLNDAYDAFICGSDQIWAPTVFDPKYFLDFVEDRDKMVAYAPSTGMTEISDRYIRNRFKECVTRFKYLSVREVQGSRLLKEISGKEVEVVLDPTLLLECEEWDQMASEQLYESPYILCYFLGNNADTWHHVYRVSLKTNLPVKVIPVFARDVNRGYDVVAGVGPREFIALIRNASVVCTDSFHGTLFSIIYEKPFYVYTRFSDKDVKSQNSRIYNILHLLGLETRLVVDKTKVEKPFYDPLPVKTRLETLKEKSLSYLSRSLYESTSAAKVDNSYTYKITNTCCGCGVCATVCAYGAIEILRNKDGFLEASVNPQKCVRCSVCRRVCPFNGKRSKEITHEQPLYMLKSKDNSVLNNSSSGGAAYEIARMLCSEGYDVVGCKYDRHRCEAVHTIVAAEDIEGLTIFRGSKYLQSNMLDILHDVIAKKKVVIFGTPCQIAGIDRLIRSRAKRDDYVLVDLICHGVPTQNLWKKYIDWGSKKYGYGKTPAVQFRAKELGWRKMHMKIEGNGKTYVMRDREDLFYRFFLLGHCFMSACYECLYRVTSAADIRVGDYWGPRYKRDRSGVSMVIAMTVRGQEILETLQVRGKVYLEKKDSKEYWSVQYPYNPIKPVFYEELMADLRDESLSLEEIAEKYCRWFEQHRKVSRLYSTLKPLIRKVRIIK